MASKENEQESKKVDLLDPAKTPIVQQWFSRRPPSPEDMYFEQKEMLHESEVKEVDDASAPRSHLRVVPSDGLPRQEVELSNEGAGGLWQRFQRWLERVLSKGSGDQWRP
jgi:hypothetical protein